MSQATIPFPSGGKPRVATPDQAARLAAARNIKQLTKWDNAAVIVVGCLIPFLSLFCAASGGISFDNSEWNKKPLWTFLGVVFTLLYLVFLAVSANHLARAFGKITGVPQWVAWAIAIGMDCTMTACDLTFVAGYDKWWYGIPMALVMVILTASSMFLNCWTMLQDKRHQPQSRQE